MSHLRRYLERTAALPADELDMAVRRQQIYGGSLDSVLLELELVDAHTLGELLVHASATCFQDRRQAVAKLAEKLVMSHKLFAPRCAVDSFEFGKLLRRHALKALPRKVLEARHYA